MLLSSPPIYFYLPQDKWPEPMPESADNLRPVDGASIWILQTYLRLREVDFSCQLVSDIPHEGIVVGHRESLSYELKPTPKLLLVCIKGDQNSLPYAQLHIVQNLQEVTLPPIHIQSIEEKRYILPGKRYYLPHWPQPGIIPRNPNRGDRFENIVYFGITYNLAPPLRQNSWYDTVRKLKLDWCVQTQGDRWHDYSEVDAIVAVRSFDPRLTYPWKPATKLYQAWHAGVPAILGTEKAFAAERKSELDYLEVTSVAELVEALKRLRDDSSLRQAMIENGKERAKETQSDVLTRRWCHFLNDIAVPAYYQWCHASSWERQQFFTSRNIAVKLNQITMKILSLKLF